MRENLMFFVLLILYGAVVNGSLHLSEPMALEAWDDDSSADVFDAQESHPSTNEEAAKAQSRVKADQEKSVTKSRQSPKGPKVEQLGHQASSKLKDTRVCFFRTKCFFKGRLKSKVNEKAETAHNNKIRKTGGNAVKLKFYVQSQCGSKTHQFYVLRVTDYESRKDSKSNANEAKEAICKFGTYFSQRKLDGKIENIYSSPEDKKFASRIKEGVLESLSKKIHKAASQKVKRREKGSAVSYLFEDQDTRGTFKARHTIRHEGGGVVTLVESKLYDLQGLNNQESEDKTKSHEVLDGQKMDIEQKGDSETKIGGDGRAKDLKEKDKLSVGTTRKLHPKPIVPSPSPGKTKFNTGTTVERIGRQTIKKNCRRRKSNAEFEADIDSEFGGFRVRRFRTPLSQDEMETEDWKRSPHEPYLKLQKAKHLLSNSGKKGFPVRKLTALVHENNVEQVFHHGFELYREGKLSLLSMKKVLGAIADIRSEPSYRKLLDVLHSKVAAPTLRTQAVVSLLHRVDEDAAPLFVVNSVAHLASQPRDRMHAGATMLLGALLRKHPASEMVMTHLDRMKDELATLSPNSKRTRMRACTLISAFANAGRHGRQYAQTIRPFLRSKNEQVRDAAEKTLDDLGVPRQIWSDDQKTDDIEQKEQQTAQQQTPAADEWEPWSKEPQSQNDWAPWNKHHAPDPDEWDPWDSSEDLQLDTSNVPTMTLDYAHPKYAKYPYIDKVDGEESYSRDSFLNLLDVDPDEGFLPMQEKPTKSGDTPTFGGSKKIIDLKISLAGGGPFSVKGQIQAGARWSTHALGGNAMGFIKAKVLHFGSELVRIGAHGKLYPSDKKEGGASGGIGWYLMILGMKVAGDDYPIEAPDIHFGVCPKDVWTAPGARRRPPTMFFKTLFKFSTRFMIGPVPCKLTISVVGGVGYGIIFGAYPGGCGGFALIAGSYPRGRVDIIMEAAVDIGIASAGIEGMLMILRGDVPGYIVGTPFDLCARIDLELQALSGKIFVFVKVLILGKFKLKILEWEGPIVRIHILKICLNFKKPIGQIGAKGSQKKPWNGVDPPSWEKKVDKKLAGAFGKNFRMFPGPNDYDPTAPKKKNPSWPEKSTGNPGWPNNPPQNDGKGVDTNSDWPYDDNGGANSNSNGGANSNSNGNGNGFPNGGPPRDARKREEKIFREAKNRDNGNNGHGNGNGNGNGGYNGPYRPSVEPYEPEIAAAREITRYAERVAKHLENPVSKHAKDLRWNSNDKDIKVLPIPVNHNIGGTAGVPHEFRIAAGEHPTPHYNPELQESIEVEQKRQQETQYEENSLRSSIQDIADIYGQPHYSPDAE